MGKRFLSAAIPFATKVDFIAAQLFFSKIVREFCFRLATRDFFCFLQVSLQHKDDAFAEKSDKIFWTSFQKMNIACGWKVLERLESWEIQSVRCPNVLNASSIPEQQALLEYLRYRCCNVSDRLFTRKNKSRKDQKERMTRRETSQRELIQDLTVPSVYRLDAHLEVIWKKQCVRFVAQHHVRANSGRIGFV